MTGTYEVTNDLNEMHVTYDKEDIMGSEEGIQSDEEKDFQEFRSQSLSPKQFGLQMYSEEEDEDRLSQVSPDNGPRRSQTVKHMFKKMESETEDDEDTRVEFEAKGSPMTKRNKKLYLAMRAQVEAEQQAEKVRQERDGHERLRSMERVLQRYQAR